MPLYSYFCSSCEKEFDRFRPLKEYRDPQQCDCGAWASKIIKPTLINFDIPPWASYESPTSGKTITSYKQRKEDMKRTGCVDYEPSMKKEYNKKQKESEQKLEKAFDATVDKTIAQMPSDKQERLVNELKSGADVEYTRA